MSNAKINRRCVLIVARVKSIRRKSHHGKDSAVAVALQENILEVLAQIHVAGVFENVFAVNPAFNVAAINAEFRDIAIADHVQEHRLNFFDSANVGDGVNNFAVANIIQSAVDRGNDTANSSRTSITSPPAINAVKVNVKVNPNP